MISFVPMFIVVAHDPSIAHPRPGRRARRP
jgi:hypothetical protein